MKPRDTYGQPERHRLAYQRRNRCFRLISIDNGCNKVLVETHEHPRSMIHPCERTGPRGGNGLSRRNADCHSQCTHTLQPVLGFLEARQDHSCSATVYKTCCKAWSRKHGTCLLRMWDLALSERVQKAGSISRHPLFGMCCGDGRVKVACTRARPGSS